MEWSISKIVSQSIYKLMSTTETHKLKIHSFFPQYGKLKKHCYSKEINSKKYLNGKKPQTNKQMDKQIDK